jgi:DNA-directed RNA polymerase alpha subunit
MKTLKESFDLNFSHFQGKCNTLLYDFYNALSGAYKFPDAELARLNSEIVDLKVEIRALEKLLAIYQDNPDANKIIKASIHELLEHADRNVARRITSCLMFEEIHTVEDLIKYTELDLKKIPNFGRKCLTELNNVLNKFNLSLKK